MSNNERRARERVDFNIQATIKHNGQSVTSTLTRDLSPTGLYMEVDETLPEGTECDINIDITGISTELILDLSGKVAREDPGEGMAIEFTDLDLDTNIFLQHLASNSIY